MRWTNEEELYLYDNHEDKTAGEMAKDLNRSTQSVYKKMRELKIDTKGTSKLTDEAKKFIKDNYEKMLDVEISLKLKVSREVIRNYRQREGLIKSYSKKWDEKSINELRELAKILTRDQLATHFECSKDAISSAASKNNILLIDSKQKWTDKDKENLKELAKTHSLEEAAEILGKTTDAVRKFSKRKSIEFKSTKKVWTEKEDILLKKLVEEGKHINEIYITLGFSFAEILKKLNKLGISYNFEYSEWTDEDIEKLIILSECCTPDEMTFILNKSYFSVRSHIRKYDLTINQSKRTWTNEDYILLQKFAEQGKTVSEIAKLMNRSENSIKLKISRRNLSKYYDNNKWTNEEESLLIDLYPKKTILEIADILNKSEDSIKNKAFALGLSSPNNIEDGIYITKLEKLLMLKDRTIIDKWVPLGFNISIKLITGSSTRYYVTYDDLYSFHEKNPDLFDISLLEEKKPKKLLNKIN